MPPVEDSMLRTYHDGAAAAFGCLRRPSSSKSKKAPKEFQTSNDITEVRPPQAPRQNLGPTSFATAMIRNKTRHHRVNIDVYEMERMQQKFRMDTREMQRDSSSKSTTRLRADVRRTYPPIK
ncbi:hypothetical protein EVAR_59061_1 [Eumeta japonica]|uniref:Uncharacterized protein n=1 Tax=Eumeta variegata TaxID=151549 RepID=A0A4C1YE92_EUMVA|nr:hypothetical protein EVAR_59061_1 [Eumeta japonica]